ncbi:MAG TPA: 2-amino-4-hydroxy-6-hydroxymethyldihydropteridine diphosphokinase [Actinomycetaceae bacterium]|nr:2-amino-4-hydroxy-6-hydroxymethyldihydropteridine diphosphokinase [Actinomycetaceae bacterium]
MSDRITLTGVRARGYHGVLASERAEGQEFSVDVVLHLDTRSAAATDDLSATVNYAEVAQDAVDVIAGPPADLIETVAARIADRALARPGVTAVDVTVHKPHAPIPVPFDDVTVHIRRTAEDGAAAPGQVVLALGANQGDARATLAAALSELDRHPRVRVAGVSPLLRSPAQLLPGAPEQPDYLNAVAILDTSLPLRELLALCQGVELAHGRVRAERWGPRPLDLDIIAAGPATWHDADLTVPHPRAHERSFVLAPWARIDPAAVLPGHGRVAELAAATGDLDWVATDWWQR